MLAIPLRRATLSDAPDVGALHVACWHETYRGILPDEMLASLSVDSRTAMWSKILGEPSAFVGTEVCVAEDQGRVIGFASCGGQRDEGLKRLGGETIARSSLRQESAVWIRNAAVDPASSATGGCPVVVRVPRQC